MKKEIELKFRVDDFALIRKKLRALGAKLLWGGKEKCWFLDTKTKTLRRKKILLRVREMDRGQVTLKEKYRVEHGMRIAHEYEVVVSDLSIMRAIFQHLGFSAYFYYSKRREHWRLPGAHIELDTLDPRHRFVEVEASKDKIRKLAGIFNLDFTKSTVKTYGAILEELRKKK